MMKKVVLGFGVILAFIGYSFEQRSKDNVIVMPPTSSGSSATAISGSGTMPMTSPSSSTGSASTTTASQYKDGTYTGSPADAYYGYIQVQAKISGGKITDVVFLQYPNDQGNSRYINSQAMPYLKQEAISAQSANVDTITGATDTSMAFVQSLTSALSQAKS